ncbi:DUF1308 domain-containing protein [Myxococcus stipitatus]|uniref:DUF1308 domain-containing protein n=1 Tax=Myxococcus stipitatus TaxID=83455 RepID=UPI000A034E4E
MGRAMVMTETAATEFQSMIRVAGPEEAERTKRFLGRVSVVPHNPSARSMGLNVTKGVGVNDIRTFGTGNAMGTPTMTSDAKFLRGAPAQEVDFGAFAHAPVPLRGP